MRSLVLHALPDSDGPVGHVDAQRQSSIRPRVAGNRGRERADAASQDDQVRRVSTVVLRLGSLQGLPPARPDHGKSPMNAFLIGHWENSVSVDRKDPRLGRLRRRPSQVRQLPRFAVRGRCARVRILRGLQVAAVPRLRPGKPSRPQASREEGDGGDHARTRETLGRDENGPGWLATSEDGESAEFFKACKWTTKNSFFRRSVRSWNRPSTSSTVTFIKSCRP